MTPPRFAFPQESYLSSGFLLWSKPHAEKAQEEPGRQLFPLARHALYYGLKSFRIGQGDEVLVPAYICTAAVDAVRASGAVPVFFRVGRDCSFDWEDVQRRISLRSRALLVVHYFGFPQNLRPARELADRHKLALIEDCAHVLHGEIEGKPLGSIGDASVFSWRKFLPTLYGGALVMHSEEAVRPELLSPSPWTELKTLKRLLDSRVAHHGDTWIGPLLQFPADLIKSARRMASHVAEQAPQEAHDAENSGFDLRAERTALSRVSRYVLEHSDVAAIAAKRKRNYQGLWERLSRIAGVRPLFPTLPENNCPLHFPVFLGNSAGMHRHLRELGVPATAWDGVRPAGVSEGPFPESDFLYENLVFLPVHQDLRDRDLDVMSDAISMLSQKKKIAAATMGSPGTPSPSRKTASLVAAQESATEVRAGALRNENMDQKKVLIVAFHFPPQAGSSGVLRTLKYCRYLPESGWLPTVLTVHPRVYDQIDEGQLGEVPSQVKVIRAMGFDTRKHLSLAGRYPQYAALPDRWVTWCLGAIPAGIREIRKNKANVIYTTFPVASAVLIGYLLHRFTGVPWVADFRDSMTEDNYPRDPLVRRVYRWLEKKAVRHASRLIFTARSTRQMYLQRFPDLAPEKCLVISNGYDEQDFSTLSQPAIADQDATVRVQHSGLIYPEERNPVPFFQALARLKKEDRIRAGWFSVDLRACGHEERYREIVAQLEIEDLVRFLPALPYRQALEDSNQADALLLLQGASCDHQIPAKAYEYVRLRKPILALTSQTGDTAALLNECGGATIVDLDDPDAIYQALPAFLTAVRAGTHPLPRMEALSRYSRQSQARELAHCLSEVVEGGVTAASVPAAKRSQTAP